MKKSGRVLLVLILASVLLISCIGFISAGWLGDFFGKITGKTTSTTCIDQACDMSPRDGIVDTGKSCTGTFKTWYPNNSYTNLAAGNSYIGGEWIANVTAIVSGQYSWYWAYGNCNAGLYPRYLWINKSSGWAWGEFFCNQTGTNICGAAAPIPPSSCLEGAVCILFDGDTVNALGRDISIDSIISGAVTLNVSGIITNSLGVGSFYQADSFKLTIMGIVVESFVGGLKQIMFNYSTTASLPGCLNQNCDNETANGIVDAGKFCSGNFTTQYHNGAYINLAVDVNNRAYADGEWLLKQSSSSDWYWAYGNCSRGLYPRWISIDTVAGGAYGTFFCNQTGVNICGTAAETPAPNPVPLVYNCTANISDVDCNDNGFVDAGKSCSGLFNSWVLMNVNFSLLNTTASSWTNLGGEWWWSNGNGWYYTYGNCSQGTYGRWLSISNYADNWAWGFAMNCSQNGTSYCSVSSSGGDNNPPLTTPNCTTIGRCTYSSVCVANGFRVNNSALGRLYCNVPTNSFIIQKAENASCQNDYECISNLCLQERCTNLITQIATSRTLMDRMICWVQKIFNPSLNCS